MKKILTILVILTLALFLGCSQNDSADTQPAAAAPETEETATAPERPAVETARIGVMIGSTNVAFAEGAYPEAEITRFNDYAESTAALQAGEIDYAMMDYTTAIGFVRNNPALTMLPEPLTQEATAIALNKNNAELNEKIIAIIDEYIANGTMDDILNRWIKIDGSDYEIVEVEKLADAPVLRVTVSTLTEPRAFVKDGEIAGVAIELMDRVAYDLGMVAEYQDLPFGEHLSSLVEDKTDVVPAMYANAERMELVKFTAAFFDNPQVFVVLK